MKSQQIKKLLKGMYDSFLATIPEVSIQDEIKNNSYIAGGGAFHLCF